MRARALAGLAARGPSGASTGALITDEREMAEVEEPGPEPAESTGERESEPGESEPGEPEAGPESGAPAEGETPEGEDSA